MWHVDLISMTPKGPWFNPQRQPKKSDLKLPICRREIPNYLVKYYNCVSERVSFKKNVASYFLEKML